MFKEVFERWKSKERNKNGIFSEFLWDGEKLLMEGESSVPDALALPVLNWWHKWESRHAHDRRLWSMIKHTFFGSRL